MVVESQQRARRPGVLIAAPRRRRWRRWPALACAAIALVTVAVTGWTWGAPDYRPDLQVTERYGIDVSNHQGRIDWPAVAGDGISSAYIKATEGDDFKDRRFQENWAGAGEVNISRGAYHFFTLCSPGAVQAENFLHSLPAGPGSLPPAVDLEFSGCRNRPALDGFQRELRTFVTSVESRTGRRIVIYGVDAFLDRYPLPADVERDRWVRHLFRRPDGDWAVWQVSDRARVAGINEPVDLDVFRPPRG